MQKNVPAAGTILLKQLVSQLTLSFMPLTQERHSFIVNHISPGLTLSNDENLLSLTLGNLIRDIILLSREQCIQVHAAENGEAAQIQVNCSDARFYQSLLAKTAEMQLHASQIGAHISMSRSGQHGTTVSLSFAKAFAA